MNLSVRQGDEIVYVERIASTHGMMRVVQIIGARPPLHITAVGKLFLLEDGSRRGGKYAARNGLPRYTPNTLADVADLMRELEGIRRKGFAFDNEEAEKGVSCIGAGIRDDEGRLVAGLSASAPSDRLNRQWAIRVKETADQRARAVGFDQVPTDGGQRSMARGEGGTTPR